MKNKEFAELPSDNEPEPVELPRFVLSEHSAILMGEPFQVNMKSLFDRYYGKGKVMQWVSVKERRPDVFTKVLLWADSCYRIGYLIQDYDWVCYLGDEEEIKTCEPTHWAELPDAPQGEKPKPVDPTWNV